MRETTTKPRPTVPPDVPLGNGLVRRSVLCPCGAKVTEMDVHPATHCGAMCLRCSDEDPSERPMRVNVEVYPGTSEAHVVSVRAFRTFDGRYAFSAQWPEREGFRCRLAPFEMRYHGAVSLYSAFAQGVALASGTSYSDAEDIRRALDRKWTPRA